MEEGAVEDWAVPTEEPFIPPEAVHEQPASRPGGHRRIVGHRRSAPPERVWLRVPDELDRQPRDPVAQAAVLPPLNGLSAAAPATPVRRSPPPSSARTPPAPPRALIPPPRPAAELLLRHPGGVASTAVVVRARGGRLRLRGDAVDGAAAALRCGAPASLHGGVVAVQRAERPFVPLQLRAPRRVRRRPRRRAHRRRRARGVRRAGHRGAPHRRRLRPDGSVVLRLSVRRRPRPLRTGRPRRRPGHRRVRWATPPRPPPPVRALRCSSPARRPSSTPRARTRRTTTCRATPPPS